MIDRDKVRDRISFIRSNLELLRGLAKTPAENFTKRSAEFHAAVRLLQISIEAMIDISSHIVSREGLGVRKEKRESHLTSAGTMSHRRSGSTPSTRAGVGRFPRNPFSPSTHDNPSSC